MGFSVLLRVVWGGVGGGVAAKVGDAAVSGRWISMRMWGVGEGKSVIGMSQKPNKVGTN
jgi:hypothetical protein